jgi:hypothetical protein
VWRLLYPRATILGFLKKKGKEKKTRRTQDADWQKFEKPALDLSAIRHCGLTYRRSERIGGTVAAFAWRAEPSSIRGRGKNSVNNRCRIAKYFRPK